MATNQYRCDCGVIHKQKEWRTAWRHALSGNRVISLRDQSGAQIELRSYPTRAMLWDFVAGLSSEFKAIAVISNEI